MSYNYRDIELPEYKEKNWHQLVDPFYQWVIDSIKDDSYALELALYDESGNNYFNGWESVDRWEVIKVVETGSDVVKHYARSTNNTSYPLLVDAWVDRETLNYTTT